MNPQRAGAIALFLTVLTVVSVDGGILVACIALAGVKDGLMYFAVAGGPPTLIYAGFLHGWFKRRLLP